MDLKPENIFFDKDSKIIKLADFTLAIYLNDKKK